MRTYIIGNDRITLCREPPAVVDEGEIVVASKQQLHAAALSGKRLLALWNALSGVQKRRKVGDRDSLIDELGRPSSFCRSRSRHPMRNSRRSSMR